MINLFNAVKKEDFNEVSKLMEIFNIDKTRLVCSEISFIIRDNNKKIGFILLVKEKPNNILFLDMYILPEYQNKGYGKQALNELCQLITEINIIAETKKTNITAINAMKNNGELVLEVNNKKYFYLPLNKADDFVNSSDYQKLYDYALSQKESKTLKIEKYY